MQRDDEFTENEYLEILSRERHLFAWCLVHYGGIDPTHARWRAEAFYEYEPEEADFRGFIFHDMAWHYAMPEIFGDGYGINNPELRMPSDQYVKEALAFLPSTETSTHIFPTIWCS